MRRFSPLALATISAALLVLTGCTGARTPPESSPPHGGIVDHPMHTPVLVTMMRIEQEAQAAQDTAIIHELRARVEAWNQGNLDTFLAMYVPEAEYVVGSRYLNAHSAVRRIHTTRWFGEGRTAPARLSADLLRSETAGDFARRVEISWTATDGAGRQETWTSSLRFRFLPGTGWRVIQELSALGEPTGEVSGPTR